MTTLQNKPAFTLIETITAAVIVLACAGVILNILPNLRHQLGWLNDKIASMSASCIAGLSPLSMSSSQLNIKNDLTLKYAVPADVLIKMDFKDETYAILQPQKLSTDANLTLYEQYIQGENFKTKLVRISK